jgi:hypothetical protein
VLIRVASDYGNVESCTEVQASDHLLFESKTMKNSPTNLVSRTWLGSNFGLAAITVVSCAFMVVPAFWIMPALDDWAASAPIAKFTPDLLLPNGTLWRPFQHLFRVAAFWFPYPAFAHAMNALGHLASIALVATLARQCGGSKVSICWAALTYSVAPAVGAAVWSVDSENQIWSNVCGLLSAVFLIGNSNFWRVVAWFVFAFLATLWNEGGIAWFIAAPLLNVFAHQSTFETNESDTSSKGHPRKIYLRCAKDVALGLLGITVYFGVRFSLQGSVALGVGGTRYGVGFHPLKIALHEAMLNGLALSTVDTLAVMSPRPAVELAVCTLILGLPFMLRNFRHCANSWSFSRWCFASLICAVVVGPFALMGHVSEMYAHRSAAVIAVMFVGSIGSTARTGQRSIQTGWVLVALAVTASLVGNAHKLWAMIDLGQSSLAVGRQVAAMIGSAAPSRLCSICDPPETHIGYSIFEASPDLASNCGLAARMFWGWERSVKIRIVPKPSACQVEDENVIRVSPSGHVEKLR